ncbi:MAG: efflux transporter outer membrane subunit [Flavobacterium sp.]|nr:efflux transporter outer membrane subunit [Flavobacterium sp.]
MNLFKKHIKISVSLLLVFFASCKSLTPVQDINKQQMPAVYVETNDTINSASIKWKNFFSDKNLGDLIDVALKNNIDLQMTLQDIEIARNNVKLRAGMLLPSVSGGISAGNEKVGLYTSQGAGDSSAEITPGQVVPESLNDFRLGLHASWEVDIWKKLRNSKKAAATRYLATIQGKNFVITNLIAEIANSYYELLSLDNQLDVIEETIALQKNALEIVKVQKEAARVSELAVKKYEAEVLNSRSLAFDIQQQIKENENKINFLLGRYPQPIVRDKVAFINEMPQQIKSGIPSQLLANRPDIKQAELELFATKCDVKAAQAEFYPSFNISGGLGFQAFKPSLLFTAPESLAYSILGELTAPLINRSAIKAEFNKAKAIQVQAMYNYQKTILTGYVEVSNLLSNIKNLEQLYDLKNKQVQALKTSIDISNDLFKSNKVDYFEVLMTQRDALSSKLELLEAKKRQFNAVINIYRSLGGGWN